MHYNGPVIRPPHEAYSVMLEVTVGCTHNSCRFCTFYKHAPFRMAPRAQIEEDLQEIAAVEPLVPRVWLAGGDPFTMSTHRLKELGALVKSYLPHANLGTYARIDSTFHKSVDELKELRAIGYNDIVIGIESGYDPVLEKMNKGYTSADIVRELKKYEAAGIDYRVIILAGIAGMEDWKENALATAKVLNEVHPFFMYLTSLTIQEDSLLYDDIQAGMFHPEEQFTMIAEFRELVAHLQNPIEIDARAGYNPVHFTAKLPDDQAPLVEELDQVLGRYSKEAEEALARRRAMFATV